MSIKKKIRKIVKKERFDSETYINYLRSIGVKIGEGTEFFYPETIFIDESRPYMITIGNNVKVTRGVSILTHGFDWCVLKGKYGDVLGSAGQVTVGNNVFIGTQSTLLKGITIGNNVIIGANSLVTQIIHGMVLPMKFA